MQTLHKIGVTGLMLAFLATSSPTAIAQQADASDSALPSLTDIQKVVETASAEGLIQPPRSSMSCASARAAYV